MSSKTVKNNPEVDVLKKRGNECIKEEKFIEAMIHYTQAVKLDPANHLLYSNRSLAFVKAQQFYHALQDAMKVIALEPNWAKGYFRKGEAEYYSEHFREAVQSYKYAMMMDPEDQALRDAVARATKKLKEQQKADWWIPLYGIAVGIIVAVIIVLSDELLTKQPTLYHPVLKIIIGVAIVGLFYLMSLGYRYLLINQRSSLLDPPLDLLGDAPDDEINPTAEEFNNLVSKNRYRNAGSRQRHRKSKT